MKIDREQWSRITEVTTTLDNEGLRKACIGNREQRRRLEREERKRSKKNRK